MAQYQLSQSIKAEQVDRKLLDLGRQVVDGRVSHFEAYNQLAWADQQRWETVLVREAEGLLLAFEASGFEVPARGMQRLFEVWENPEAFKEQVERLRVWAQVERQPGYEQAIDQMEGTYNRLMEVDDVAAGKLAWAIDKALSRETPDAGVMTTTTEWRHDTDPRLASLMKINPDQEPRYREIVNVMEAHTATGEKVPGKRYRFESPRQTGWTEIMLKAPKAVSVAWGLAQTPEERQLVLDAHRYAVHTAMLEVEKVIGVYRSGYAGQGERLPAHITWVAFHHGTARATPGQPPDPHLHSHVMVPNVVLEKAGNRVGAVHSRPLRGKNYDRVDEIYKQTLTSGLLRIGMDARYSQEPFRDIKLAHITDAMAQHFSKRGQESETAARQHLAKQGQSFDALTPTQQSIVRTKAADVIRKGRQSNQADRQMPKLQQAWQQQADRKRFSRKPGVTRDGFNRSRKYRMEPWMSEQGGVENLGAAHLANARRSYAAWAKENPEFARKYGFESYVAYVQERWQENPEMFEEKGAQSLGPGTQRIAGSLGMITRSLNGIHIVGHAWPIHTPQYPSLI